MERRVAIVGAGISGLLACKYTLSKGYQPIIFEAGDCIGGVWTKTIATTRLQTPKAVFQFADFPWPDSVTDVFPVPQEVMDYLQSYAVHFDLLRCIKFNSKVLSLSYEGVSEAEMGEWLLWGGTGEPFGGNKRKWNLEVQDTQSLSVENYQFDFVILCVGKFSGVPSIPEFPPGKGPEVYKGKVIHSMDYANMDHGSVSAFVKAKKIAVVGLGKSAMDIAMECSAVNGVENPCSMIYRRERWNIPDYLPWGVPLAYLYLNRFSELLVHKPEEGILLGFLATLLSPVRWGISKLVETHISRKLNLGKYGMVPKHSFLQEISGCLLGIVPEGFYDRVEEGSIKLVKAQNFSFADEGILIDGDAESIKTDLVILATGYRGADKLKDIFASPFFQKCIAASDDTTIPIYRECIHPRIPQLAIIGFSESLNNLYTSEIRCRWVAELLDGNLKLPGIAEMEKNVAEWNEYMKKYSGEYYKRSCIAALHIWYNDQLCKDMGWNPKRKKGLFAELFEPYGPSDYAHP